MEIKRREFIKLFGGVSGAVIFGSCALEDVFKMPDALIEKARRGPGVETWINTTCSMCPGGCGMRVRLIDSVPATVKGNPLHPVNQGGMCPLGLNALHLLYHPDRLTGPQKRIGKPGSNRLESVSWDEAEQTIASTLRDLRNEGKSNQVAFLGYNERGTMQRHIQRFMEAYGSPNYFRFSTIQNDTAAYKLLHGHHQQPAYDFLNAKLIVSFGANFLEHGFSPIYYTKLFSHHQERGTRYIQIEPRLSLTASNADHWIPIRPGTYGALALGIAYVLIREELYDTDYVRNHTFGFDDWTDASGVKHTGFKNMVLGNYYPDIVSDVTGISSISILELARELGNFRPSLVLGDQGAIDNTNGVYSLMAIQSLNALLGNYEKEGGIYFIDAAPYSALPTVQLDGTAQTGKTSAFVGKSLDTKFPLSEFSVESFVQHVLTDRPYPISVLFLYGGNPLFHSLHRHDFAEALAKIPLVISFDTMITETSEYAHYVLPDHTFLEKWDEVSNVPSVNFTHVSLQRPVVDPLYDTRHAGDVLIDLAHRLGGSVKSSFSLRDYGDQIKHAMKGVYESGQGAIFSEGVQRLWMQYLQQRGWQIGRYASFEEFWSLLLEKGGWWNPIKKQRQQRDLFQTPSKKFEFYSMELKSTIDGLIRKSTANASGYNAELVLNQLGISARGDNVYLPHFEPVPYEADRPLHLVTFQLLCNYDGLYSNLPMVQEMFGSSIHRYWTSWVEIHPETAKLYGVSDGAWIWLESSIGSLKVQAKVTPGILPNAVALPFGMGHWSSGRYAGGHGVNPNAILRNLYDPLSGKPALEATKIRISVAS